jgi:hypothetical protein
MTVHFAATILISSLLNLTASAKYGRANSDIDSTGLKAALTNGKTEAHFRYFFMATNNKKGLTDYYANAAGGGLKYETGKFHGFQAGVGGFFIFNIGSSDLSKADLTTKQINRYEIGLFDIENASNKNDIDRLEELYLKYNFKKATLTFGKQLINTPFINLQDGRMRPTGVEGLWFNGRSKNTKWEGGVLWGISPRSTVRWFNIGASIGVYPQGVQENGQASNYKEYINSKAIGIISITHEFQKDLKLQVWEQWTDNVLNTILIQVDKKWGNGGFYSGVQGIMQHTLNHGGNIDPSKTYIQKGNNAYTFGSTTGWKNKNTDISLNYNRITANGRYMMPREWGRDPFYTFLPRERNEGFGDVNATMIKLKRSFPKQRFQALIGFGYYDLPDVTNTRMNKYGMPSYTQLNLDIQYQFTGTLEGMNAQFLYVYKGQEGNSYNNNKYVIHKVNTSLFNLILNYHF